MLGHLKFKISKTKTLICKEKFAMDAAEWDWLFCLEDPFLEKDLVGAMEVETGLEMGLDEVMEEEVKEAVLSSADLEKVRVTVMNLTHDKY